jgi:Redoxin
MSPFAWIAVGVLLGLVMWLGLAVAGAARAVDVLRERVDALESRASRSGGLLPVGTLVPVWRIATADGEVVSSSTFDGRRHVVLFADATCRACEDLVPAAVAAARDGATPPLVVVGRGDATATPSEWRAADVRVRVGTERSDEVSAAFGVDLTPTAVVVDEGGAVVARAPVASLADLRALIAGAEGVRIVAAGGA